MPPSGYCWVTAVSVFPDADPIAYTTVPMPAVTGTLSGPSTAAVCPASVTFAGRHRERCFLAVYQAADDLLAASVDIDSRGGCDMPDDQPAVAGGHRACVVAERNEFRGSGSRECGHDRGILPGRHLFGR